MMRPKLRSSWLRVAVVALAGGTAMVSCSSSGGGASGRPGSGGSSGTGAGGGSGGFGVGGVGGSSTGGTGVILTDGGSTGGTTGLGDAACASETYQGEQIPVDMYVIMDRSGSMGADASGGTTVWDATKQAITSFVQAPESAGMGVGIQFFPKDTGGGPQCAFPPCPPGCLPFGPLCVPAGGGSCDLNDYLPPAVTIQLLPGVAQQIIDAMNMQSPGGGTPTLPAMQSAVQATKAYAAQVPGRKVIIVLATDGNPNDCNSTIATVAGEAANALNGSPSINTFVIGIGNVSGLDQIAVAGGTDNAIIVDPSNAGQGFLDAMNEIRGKALTCTFQIPVPGNGEMINVNQVNVRITSPGASQGDVVFNVANEAACDPVNGGWYYDDPVNPTEIRTCPATCDRIEVEQGRVDVELGCDTVKVPQ